MRSRHQQYPHMPRIRKHRSVHLIRLLEEAAVFVEASNENTCYFLLRKPTVYRDPLEEAQTDSMLPIAWEFSQINSVQCWGTFLCYRQLQINYNAAERQPSSRPGELSTVKPQSGHSFRLICVWAAVCNMIPFLPRCMEMPTWSYDENSVRPYVRLSVRPSVCQTRALWQNERKIRFHFYRAAWNADAVLRWDFCLSVRLSVCPSVRLSNACIVTKRKKIQSRFLYHAIDNLV